MIITSTDFIPGKEIIEVIDIARGSTCLLYTSDAADE